MHCHCSVKRRRWSKIFNCQMINGAAAPRSLNKRGMFSVVGGNLGGGRVPAAPRESVASQWKLRQVGTLMKSVCR